MGLPIIPTTTLSFVRTNDARATPRGRLRGAKMTDLMDEGLTAQAELVAKGEVTSRELVEASLKRIDEMDGRVNAFRVVRPEAALAEADAADARIAAGEWGPLLGVPVAIKDDTDLLGETTPFAV